MKIERLVAINKVCLKSANFFAFGCGIGKCRNFEFSHSFNIYTFPRGGIPDNKEY